MGYEGAMTKRLLRSTALAVAGVAAIWGPAGQISAPAAQTTPSAKTAPATKSDAVMGQHTMEGTVTKVNAKRGWIDVKTSEGSMKLHFPSSVLENVKAGDSVTVELGMTRTAMKKTSAAKTK
jgi:hypothetical protein